ncbi:MAG: hypothetical protein GKS01_05105 [Alphaproteobacteria bacterium]|nr:hypothetical protein [Alphaproteobacteria bacterium]
MAQVRIRVFRHKIIDLPIIGPKYHYYYDVSRATGLSPNGNLIFGSPDLTVHGVAFNHDTQTAVSVGSDTDQLVVSVHPGTFSFASSDQIVGSQIIDTGGSGVTAQQFKEYRFNQGAKDSLIITDAAIAQELTNFQSAINGGDLQYLNTFIGESQNSNSVARSGITLHGVEDDDINGLDFGSSNMPGGDRDLLQAKERLDRPEDVNFCFAAGTPVDMADGSKKSIEQIKIGDEVMAYDPFAENGRGGLSPKRVTQTHVTPNRIVIDFWGTKVTPGHVFLRGDGDAEGQHQMLMDIIRDDGVVVRDDGTLIRASTNCEVGSDGDRLINVLWRTDNDSTVRQGQVRAGAIPAESKRGDMTYMDILAEGGYTLLPDGNIVRDGEAPQPLTYRGVLPKPEDYLLKRSGYTLEQLLTEDVTLDGLEGVPAPHVIAQSEEAVAEPATVRVQAGNRQERRRQKALSKNSGKKKYGNTLH